MRTIRRVLRRLKDFTALGFEAYLLTPLVMAANREAPTAALGAEERALSGQPPSPSEPSELLPAKPTGSACARPRAGRRRIR